MFIPFFLASLAVAVVGDVLDVVTTEKCIAKGAVETNTFLVGSKPTAARLFLKDALFLSIVVGGVFLARYLNPAVGYGALAAPVAYGGKHFLGYHNGKLWLAGKAPDPNAPQSAWQKFLS